MLRLEMLLLPLIPKNSKNESKADEYFSNSSIKKFQVSKLGKQSYKIVPNTWIVFRFFSLLA